MLTGKMELYDLTADISEQHDVAEQHPEIVSRAAAAMQQAHVPSPDWKPGAPSQPGESAEK